MCVALGLEDICEVWVVRGYRCWLIWIFPGPHPNWQLCGLYSLLVCRSPIYIPLFSGSWEPSKRLLWFVTFPLLARIDLWLAKPDLNSEFAGQCLGGGGWIVGGWGYRWGGLDILLLGYWTLNYGSLHTAFVLWNCYLWLKGGAVHIWGVVLYGEI